MTADTPSVYSLICQKCPGTPDWPRQELFNTAAERKTWKIQHTAETGHDDNDFRLDPPDDDAD